jgi:pyridoxal 5'-phosphate synthase pdxS subunit
MRTVQREIKRIKSLDNTEIVAYAKNIGSPVAIVQHVKENGKLPVPNFAAGGIATPADASLMMQLGAESVFVGSGIFKSADPPARARAIVIATTHYKNPDEVAKASEGLGDAMRGIDVASLPEDELIQTRGW